MERPYFHILAHPTGRLIQEREPYDVDMPRIIRQARRGWLGKDEMLNTRPLPALRALLRRAL